VEEFEVAAGELRKLGSLTWTIRVFVSLDSQALLLPRGSKRFESVG
jgi:hypothetical protein